MGLRSWAKRQAKKAKKGAEKIGKKTKQGAEKAAKETKKGVEKAAKETKKGVEKAAKETEKGVEKAARETEKGVEKAAKEAEKGVNEAVDKVEEGLSFVAEEIEEAVMEVVDTITSKVLEEGVEVSLDLVKSAKHSMEQLKTARPELSSSIDELGFCFTIGPVELKYQNFLTKADNIAEVLERLLSKTLTPTRTTILNTVDALSPDSVDLGISVDIAALFVTSDALGVGFKINEINTDLFLELGDVLLKKLGVPK